MIEWDRNMNENNNTFSQNLSDFTSILARNWLLVALVFMSFASTVAVFTFTAQPKYEASATLSIQEDTSWNDRIFDIKTESQQKNLIKNQVTILESRTLTNNVVKRLKASDMRDSLAILKPASSRSFFFLKHNRFHSIPNRPDSGIRKISDDELIERFYASTRVSYRRDSDILYLKGRASAPLEAAYLVNMWVDVYKDYNSSDNRGEVIEVRNFLEIKLHDIEKELAASEERLKNYQKINQVVSLPDETDQLIQQLSNFESQYNQTKMELEALDKQLTFLKNQLDESKKNLVEDMTKMSNPVLNELQKQMAELETQKVAYEAQLAGAGYDNTSDPKLAQMENRLRGLKDRIVEETQKLVQSDMPLSNPLGYSENLIAEILRLETNRQSLSTKTEALKVVVGDYSKKLESLPEKSLILARLERDIQLNTKIYTMLKEKYEETRIQESGQPGIIRVLDRATPPSSPIRPNIPLNLFLGCFCGLLMGIAFVWMKEFLKDTIQDGKDLEKIGVHLIGTVPVIRKGKRMVSVKEKEKDSKTQRARSIYPYLLTHQADEYLSKEVYRVLRTSIYYTLKQNQWQTLLFTSMEPSEGKSTTVSNLAISIAEKGINTLLVDSDLRKPVLDLLFMGADIKDGLTSYLGQKVGWRDVVRETAVKGLDFIGSGPVVKNAPEVLGTNGMLHFLNEAKRKYGVILFDSPPLLPVTDALILASEVDAVVLVVRAGRTTKKEIRKSIELIKSVGGVLFGAILTGSKKPQSDGYRSYYKA
jgi:succinoglycan biosynthesis transport protein ExoP